MSSIPKKPFIYRIPFKLLLLVSLFIPPYSQNPYHPLPIDLVLTVTTQPLIIDLPFLLPFAKLLLLLVTAFAFLRPEQWAQTLLAYYTFMLMMTGVFQNMSLTAQSGFVWFIGNTFILFIAAAVCCYDMIKKKTEWKWDYFALKHIWVLGPMLFAWLMPYATDDRGLIQPAFGVEILTNEAGLTYQMITPVVLGVMILFAQGMYRPTLFIVSLIGLFFGITQLLISLVFQADHWWMAVLHLPLVTLASYALFWLRREERTDDSIRSEAE